MNAQAKSCNVTHFLWFVLVAVCLSMTMVLSASALEGRRSIGISPLVSNVADVPVEAAQELFVDALMRTDRFAIHQPDAKGSFVGVEYVLEPTINEGKAKANVLGFLKDSVSGHTPVSLNVRVFNSQTAALVSVVTVNSAEIKSGAGMSDIQSMLGALNAGSQQSSESVKLEERLGGVMLQAANRLAAQVGGTKPNTGMQRAGAPRTSLSR